MCVCVCQEASLTSSENPADVVFVALKIPNVLLSARAWTHLWLESALRGHPGQLNEHHEHSFAISVDANDGFQIPVKGLKELGNMMLSYQHSVARKMLQKLQRT